MSRENTKHRCHLPMPNTTHPKLITYDAKDPDTKLVPIEQLCPPKGAPTPDAQKALATLFDSRTSEADYLDAMQYHAI